jgi:hypothetical protein
MNGLINLNFERRFKVKILFFIFLVLFSCQKKIENNTEENSTSPPSVKEFYGELPENDWKVENSISSDNGSTILLVTTKEKYGGFRSHYAKVVFSNYKTHQYRLIAPWYKVIELQWSLITEKKVVEIPIDSIPKDREDIWSILNKKN